MSDRKERPSELRRWPSEAPVPPAAEMSTAARSTEARTWAAQPAPPPAPAPSERPVGDVRRRWPRRPRPPRLLRCYRLGRLCAEPCCHRGRWRTSARIPSRGSRGHRFNTMSRGCPSVIGRALRAGVPPTAPVVLGVPHRDADGGASRLGGDVSDDGVVAPSTAGAPEPDTAAEPPPWLAPTVRRRVAGRGCRARGVAGGRPRARVARAAVDPGDRAVLRPGHGAGGRPPARTARALPGHRDRGGLLAVAATVQIIFFCTIPGIFTAADAVGARLPMLLDDLRTVSAFGSTRRPGTKRPPSSRHRYGRGLARAPGGRRRNIRGRGSAVRSSPSRRSRSTSPLMHHGSGAASSPGCRCRVAAAGVGAGHGDRQTGGYAYRLAAPPDDRQRDPGLRRARRGRPAVVGRPAVGHLPGFFAEFIPAVGTYIGAAVPVVVTWALPASGPPSSSSSGWSSISRWRTSGWPPAERPDHGGQRGGGLRQRWPAAPSAAPWGRSPHCHWPPWSHPIHSEPWAVLPIGARLSARPAPVIGPRAAPERRTIFQRSRR